MGITGSMWPVEGDKILHGTSVQSFVQRAGCEHDAGNNQQAYKLKALNYILNTIFIQALASNEFTLCQAMTQAIQRANTADIATLKNATKRQQELGGNAALEYLRAYVEKEQAGKSWFQKFKDIVFIRQPSQQDLMRAWIAAAPSLTLFKALRNEGVPNQGTLKKLMDYEQASQEPKRSNILAISAAIEILRMVQPQPVWGSEDLTIWGSMCFNGLFKRFFTDDGELDLDFSVSRKELFECRTMATDVTARRGSLIE